MEGNKCEVVLLGQKGIQVDTKLFNKEVTEENSVDDEAKVEKIPLKSRISLELYISKEYCE